MTQNKEIVEGQLFQLAINPGEQNVVGVMMMTKDGEQEGRYMRRPEQTYGSFTFDGTPVNTLAILIEKILEGKCIHVKWTSELFVEFTKEEKE